MRHIFAIWELACTTLQMSRPQEEESWFLLISINTLEIANSFVENPPIASVIPLLLYGVGPRPRRRSRMELTDLPEEILLQILTFLPVCDLLQASRTCHFLRVLCNDPLLHHERRRRASQSLARALNRRVTRASISPPNAWIWLSKTYVLSRAISKSLIRIRLNHTLERRPTAQDLVSRAILPSCSHNVSPAIIQSQQAVQKSKLKDGLGRKLERRPSMSSLVSMNIIPEECANRCVSPALVETRRKVIRESLKDGLRAWIENRGLQAQRKRADDLEASESSTVKAVVRRFAAKKLAQELEEKIDPASLDLKKTQARWGRAVELQKRKDERKIAWGGFACSQPTRAHVLGLRRFWEGVIRAAGA